MPITARRQPWTTIQWFDFADRCRDLRIRISDYVSTFPISYGHLARHTDALIALDSAFVSAITGTETLCERQHPDLVASYMSRLHRWDDREPRPIRERWPRNAILPRERWMELGQELKAIDAARIGIWRDLADAGAPKYATRRFVDFGNRVKRLKCRLDELVYQQHRDWPEFSRVFYGPQTPIDPPKLISVN